MIIVFGFVFSIGYVAVMLKTENTEKVQRTAENVFQNENRDDMMEFDYMKEKDIKNNEDGLSRFVRKTVKKC